MCNHSSYQNLQLHERINNLVLVRKMWRSSLQVIILSWMMVRTLVDSNSD
jgi:hypothetical protein